MGRGGHGPPWPQRSSATARSIWRSPPPFQFGVRRLIRHESTAASFFAGFYPDSSVPPLGMSCSRASSCRSTDRHHIHNTRLIHNRRSSRLSPHLAARGPPFANHQLWQLWLVGAAVAPRNIPDGFFQVWNRQSERIFVPILFNSVQFGTQGLLYCLCRKAVCFGIGKKSTSIYWSAGKYYLRSEKVGVENELLQYKSIYGWRQSIIYGRREY